MSGRCKPNWQEAERNLIKHLTQRAVEMPNPAPPWVRNTKFKSVSAEQTMEAMRHEDSAAGPTWHVVTHPKSQPSTQTIEVSADICSFGDLCLIWAASMQNFSVSWSIGQRFCLSSAAFRSCEHLAHFTQNFAARPSAFCQQVWNEKQHHTSKTLRSEMVTSIKASRNFSQGVTLIKECRWLKKPITSFGWKRLGNRKRLGNIKQGKHIRKIQEGIRILQVPKVRMLMAEKKLGIDLLPSHGLRSLCLTCFNCIVLWECLLA